MAFTLDSEGFYTPPSDPSILWPFWCFGTRAASVPHLPMATLHQTHSARVIRVEEPGLAGEGDALITRTPDLLLAIKTADCVPLLLVDFNHRAVASVHAGWRGTAQGIAGAAIRAMEDAYGTDPHDVRAAVGPAIGSCCFEVGPEVVKEFEGYRTAVKPSASKPGDRSYVDLPSINRQQLEAAGIPPEQIYDSGLCTMCHPAEFHSYRRDREMAGRMHSLVAVRNKKEGAIV